MGFFGDFFDQEDAEQTTTLPAFQEAAIEGAVTRAGQLHDTPPDVFTDPRIAGISQTTEAGLDLATQEAGQLGEVADAARFILGDSLNVDPTSRPEFQNSLAVVGSRLSDTLNEDVLPGVRNRAAAQGAFGGSRQSLTEGRAIEDTQRALGDAGTNLASDFFKTLTTARSSALGQLPSILGAQIAPSSQLRDVGGFIDQRAQLELNDEVDRFNDVQNAPEEALDRFIARITGDVGSTTTINQGNDPLRNIAGVAGIGSVLGGLFGGDDDDSGGVDFLRSLFG